MRIALVAILFLVGCANPNTKLVDGRSDGSIYTGGMVSQRVNGDSTQVAVWNVWSAEDGLSLANQHCQSYGKTGAEISHQSGITAYYKCAELSETVRQEILESDAVRRSIEVITRCIRTNVVVLDDFVSDANTIAQAVAQQCRKSMNDFVDTYVSQIPNSNSMSKTYITELKSGFAEGEKERVLPFILGWRSLVNKGWDKQTPPSKDETPDELFYQAI